MDLSVDEGLMRQTNSMLKLGCLYPVVVHNYLYGFMPSYTQHSLVY
jgi:hypothetical protein